MNLLIILFMVAAVVVIVVLKLKQMPVDGGLSFTKRDVLFTPAERSFFGVLEQALEGRYRVFGKVRLGDIVKPAKGLSNSKRATAQNKVNQKHVDFVVCTASNLAVIGVVELDDKSHERDDRAGRDRFIDQTLADAKIPIVHFPAQKGYEIAEVRAKLAVGLAAGAPPAVQSASVAVSPVPEKVVAMPVAEKQAPVAATPKPATPTASVEKTAAPVCPKCSSAMVKRQATKGPHAGKFFWACSAFPKCRQVVAVEAH